MTTDLLHMALTSQFGIRHDRYDNVNGTLYNNTWYRWHSHVHIRYSRLHSTDTELEERPIGPMLHGRGREHTSQLLGECSDTSTNWCPATLIVASYLMHTIQYNGPITQVMVSNSPTVQGEFCSLVFVQFHLHWWLLCTIARGTWDHVTSCDIMWSTVVYKPAASAWFLLA